MATTNRPGLVWTPDDVDPTYLVARTADGDASYSTTRHQTNEWSFIDGRRQRIAGFEWHVFRDGYLDGNIAISGIADTADDAQRHATFALTTTLADR